MQTLYEWDFRPGTDIKSIKDRNIANYEEDADDGFIDQTIEGIIKNIKNIDSEIIKAAPEWPIEQIASIDKTILRISIYEILESDDVPPKVAINEAVELGKTFGGQNSSKFINGVLGIVYRSSPRYNPEDDKPKKAKEELEK
ncbi:MAG: putative transcription termination factor [Candidatus Berkelbacteria bacterium]|nr:putative transcription termination factor [Candidatus Berkelbacteria bacterium]